VSYYGAGDYYGSGGLGSFLGGVARAGVGFLTGGPVGAIASVASSFAPKSSGGGIPVLPVPGLRGAAQRAIPGGATGLMIGRPRRRRMQYTNQKALTRANRRVDGFVKVVKKSLKHTNYQLVTKGTRRGAKRDLGAGHTHVR